MTYKKPAYDVTVGSSFWCPITSRDNTTITYDTDVIEVPSVKTLTLSRVQTESTIYASGVIYDSVTLTSGATIALSSVALPTDLINQLEGATVVDGFSLNNSNDTMKEFAFGYWGELSNGEFVYFWHPVCKLTPGDESLNTKTADAIDPNKDYTVTVIPYNGLWRVKYSTEDAAAAGKTPLTKDEFFTAPIFDPTDLPTQEDTGSAT
jgi:phi13 family phage major tail protein